MDIPAPAASVELSVEDGVAVVTLNRPDVRNAIDDTARAQLIDALDRAAADEAVKAVVLTGRGSAFSAGGDVGGMKARLAAPAGQVAFNGWRRQKQTHRAVEALFQLDKPTIAAVNGPAAGLGCDLALACDFIVASEQARFLFSFIQRGLVPDGGGLYFLPRRVGLSKAKALVFTGATVDAAEALAIGLADRVSPAETLMADALAWARQMTAGSPAALALGKSILNRSLDLTVEEVLALGREAQAICYTTDEHRASVTAFLDRAKP